MTKDEIKNKINDKINEYMSKVDYRDISCDYIQIRVTLKVLEDKLVCISSLSKELCDVTMDYFPFFEDYLICELETKGFSFTDIAEIKVDSQMAWYNGEREEDWNADESYFEVEIMSKEDVMKNHIILFNTAKHYFPAMTESEILTVVSLVLDTCPYCYAGNKRCYCPPKYDE